MCDEKEGLRQCGGEENCGDETAAGCENSEEEKRGNERKEEDGEKERRKRRRRIVSTILIVIIIILILLCFRSCRARDEPLPDGTGRTYEEKNKNRAQADWRKG